MLLGIFCVEENILQPNRLFETGLYITGSFQRRHFENLPQKFPVHPPDFQDSTENSTEHTNEH